jgi:hypothetical protein
MMSGRRSKKGSPESLEISLKSAAPACASCVNVDVPSSEGQTHGVVELEGELGHLRVVRGRDVDHCSTVRHVAESTRANRTLMTGLLERGDDGVDGALDRRVNVAVAVVDVDRKGQPLGRRDEVLAPRQRDHLCSR